MGFLKLFEGPSPELLAPPRCQDPKMSLAVPFLHLSSHPRPIQLLLFFHLRFLPSVVKIRIGNYLLLGIVLRKSFFFVFLKIKIKKKNFSPDSSFCNESGHPLAP